MSKLIATLLAPTQERSDTADRFEQHGIFDVRHGCAGLLRFRHQKIGQGRLRCEGTGEEICQVAEADGADVENSSQKQLWRRKRSQNALNRQAVEKIQLGLDRTAWLGTASTVRITSGGYLPPSTPPRDGERLRVSLLLDAPAPYPIPNCKVVRLR